MRAKIWISIMFGALGLFLFFTGCSTGRQLAYGAKVFTSRTNPDYDRLEKARAVQVAPPKAAPAPVMGPEPVMVPEPLAAPEPVAVPAPEPVPEAVVPVPQPVERARSDRADVSATPEPTWIEVKVSEPEAVAAEATPPPSVSLPATPSRWTQFRGPGAAGSLQDSSLNLSFGEDGPPVLWKQPIGGGYGSFVFAGDTIVTHEQRRDEEAIVAYDLGSGAEQWVHAYPAKFTETMSGEGPRSTPCLYEGRVYALGATGELHCLDLATGDVLWQKNILSETAAENLTYGLSASPVLIDGRLIVVGGAVLALDPATGEELWRSAKEKPAYVTPMAFEGTILVNTATRLVALDPASGAEQWSHPWKVMMGLSCANPVDLGGGQLFVSGGYGKGAALLDVAGNTVTERWSNKRMKNKFNTSVHHNGYLYGLDEGILTCVEAATGKRMWKGGRYSYGQVLLANDMLLVSTSKGELAMVRATPESFQEVSKTPAIEGMTWNTPALDHGRLVMRNAYEMTCFDLR